MAAEEDSVTLGEAISALNSSSERQSRPTSESVARMLAQAVRSEDRQLLEDVLSTGKEAIIRNTLQRLPVELVVPFLGELVKRVQNKPSRTIDLLPWLRICLIVHVVYLASVPDISERLGALYDLIEIRQASLPQLTRLHGRLDVMASQLNLQGAEKEKKEEERKAGPLAVVDEADFEDIPSLLY